MANMIRNRSLNVIFPALPAQPETEEERAAYDIEVGKRDHLKRLFNEYHKVLKEDDEDQARLQAAYAKEKQRAERLKKLMEAVSDRKLSINRQMERVARRLRAWLDNTRLQEKKVAIGAGGRQYAWPVPCKHGHVSYRFFSNDGCVMCDARRNGATREELLEMALKLRRENEAAQAGATPKQEDLGLPSVAEAVSNLRNEVDNP